MKRTKPQIAPGAFKLYDAYAHGEMSRRDFLDGLRSYAIGGLTVSVLAGARLCQCPADRGWRPASR